MGAVDYTIYGFCLFLQLLLLSRCLKTGQERSYPFFFSHVLYGLLRDIVLFALLVLQYVAVQYRAYARLYWVCYIVETLLWFAVGWEIFRQIFPRGSGLRRVAAGVLVSVLFLLALVFYLSGPQPGVYFIADFIRKVALSVAIWLLVVLALARYYVVPLGRNIWGMAIGLLVFVSAHIANFAAIDISPRFEPIWSLVVPFSFVLTLLIWTLTLWSYVPNPKPVAADERAQREAFSFWEQRWAALGTTIRKALKP